MKIKNSKIITEKIKINRYFRIRIQSYKNNEEDEEADLDEE